MIGFALVLAGIATMAQGQVPDEPYRLNDKQVGQLLKRMDTDADHFRKSLSSALDRSRFEDTAREGDIKSYVKDFDKETDRLRSRFGDHKSVAADVETVLDRAARIDRFMQRHALDARAERDWSQLRADLDDLARSYSVTWRWDNPGYPATAEVPPSQDIPSRLNDKQVGQLLKRMDTDADRFRKSLSSAIDRSRFEDTAGENDIKSYVRDFDKETERLRNRFGDHKAVAADVETVLDRASRIDRFMRRNALSDKAQRDWLTLRADLDELAQAYGVSWQWTGLSQ